MTSSHQWTLCATPMSYIRLRVNNAATRQQSRQCLLLPHPSSKTDSTASWTRSNISTFVLSRLDYCNAVLAGLPKVTIAPLQRVQNAAARLIILRLALHYQVTTAALRHLHWLPGYHYYYLLHCDIYKSITACTFVAAIQ